MNVSFLTQVESLQHEIQRLRHQVSISAHQSAAVMQAIEVVSRPQTASAQAQEQVRAKIQLGIELKVLIYTTKPLDTLSGRYDIYRPQLIPADSNIRYSPNTIRVCVAYFSRDLTAGDGPSVPWKI